MCNIPEEEEEEKKGRVLVRIDFRFQHGREGKPEGGGI